MNQRATSRTSVSTPRQQLPRDLRVQARRELLDALPALARAGHLARDPVGAHDLLGVRAKLALHLRDERRSHRVDHVVGDDRRHELAPQRMLGEQVAEAFDDLVGGKYAAQVGLEEGVVHERAAQQRVGQAALGVRQQHRQLRARDPLARAPALGHHVAGRQLLDAAVEQSLLLELAHQVLVGEHARRRTPAPPGR